MLYQRMEQEEKRRKGMKKTIMAIAIGVLAVSSGAMASINKPSTDNQVGRSVDHNIDDTYVNPDIFKSISVAEKGLRSFKHFENDIERKMGHIISYGNKIKNVDEFIDTDEIAGNLDIHNNTINNLNGFQNLEVIGGSFHLYNTRIKRNDLDGLLKLEKVGGDFIIDGKTFYQNENVNLRGLKSLEYVEDELRLEGVQVYSTEPLKNLRKAGYINLKNTGITEIDGLQNVKEVADINLDGNNIIDINPLYKTKVKGHLLIDKRVASNPNFRKLRKGAWLCKPENAKHFHRNGITQEQACQKR